MEKYFLWIMWFAIAEAVIIIVQLLLKSRPLGAKCLAYAAAKIVVGIIFGFLVMAGPIELRPIQPLMAALYVALLADGVADLIFSVLQIKIRTKRLLARKVISLILGSAILCFGMINMTNVKSVHLEYSSEKLENDYTFAFISDLHVGSAQDFTVIEKTVSSIKNENPDFVVLGGDITDDYTTKEDMQKAFALFKNFDCPVYYIYGNHDKQTHAEYANGRQYTIQELEETLAKNGITILQDDFVEVGEDVTILGRADLSEKNNGRKSAGELHLENEKSYFIIFDHQPTDMETIDELAPDLQFSGHTHAGQFFPLCVFNELFLGNAYGEYTHGSTTLYISSGASGWRVPCRTDAQCQFEIVHLTPAE